MDDQVVRDRLRSYLTTDEMRIRLTVDTVLAGGRRVRRRARFARWSGAALGALAVTALVAATLAAVFAVFAVREPAPETMVGAGAPDPAPFCAAARSAPVPAGSPSTWTNPKSGGQIPAPTEPAARAAARLSCYLMQVVPGYLPNTRLDRTTAASGSGAALEVRNTNATEGFFAAYATVVDSAGTGEVAFHLRPIDALSVATEVSQCADTRSRFCAVQSGPAGEQIIVLGSVPDDSGLEVLNVTVFRGGTAVLAAATNSDSRLVPAQGWPVPVTRRGGPPLTVDDLIEIATAPEMTLFP